MLKTDALEKHTNAKVAKKPLDFLIETMSPLLQGSVGAGGNQETQVMPVRNCKLGSVRGQVHGSWGAEAQGFEI